MRRLWSTLAVLAGLARGPAAGQEAFAPAPVVTFRLEQAGRPMPSYEFDLQEDGSGSFRGKVARSEGPTEEVTAPLAVSAGRMKKIVSEARELERVGFQCASKAKNVANTGAKTLTYRGAAGTGSCAFNYTENKAAETLTAAFEGMALTLEEGHKLALEHKYDRLALDGTIAVLFKAAQEGQALEMGNIVGVLRSLADDAEVLERVRMRAASLLKMAEVSP